MKLIINTDRSVIPVGTWGTVNENDYEILEFEFPAELDGYNKRIVYYLGDEKVWDTIVNNKAYITNAITTKGDVKAYVWCTKENTEREADTDFRTMLFKMHFYENENADGIVPTEEQIDGFNTMLTAMNEKIEEIDELETTIKNAEAQRQENEETRQNNEKTRQENEETRQNNEKTRQENEQTRQNQEADRERRTDEAIADIEDKTAEYNANAEAKTTAFNNNATQKTNEFNSNYTQKTNDFNTNASSKTSDFNTNATNKTNAFNSNATEKTTAFDNNASTKTSEFNTNAENKTSAFNDNATQKTTNFDNNASSKTTTFNDNAQAKTEAFDEHTAEITADIEELQQEVEELSENMPWNTTEQATEISVDDAAKYSRNKLELFGNTSQDSTSISGGDEYDSPSPDHPQPIHVVTGNNTIGVQGKNLFDKNVERKNAFSTGDIGQVVGYGNSSASYSYVNCAKVEANKTYTLSWKIDGTKGATSNRNSKIVDSNNIVLEEFATWINNTTHITFTPQNTGYLVLTTDISSVDIQLEQGSTATSYVPYYHADYPISLGSIELCKIGDYQDYLYKENGNWYKKPNILKTNFSANTRISFTQKKTNDQTFNFVFFDYCDLNYNNTLAKCTHYPSGQISYKQNSIWNNYQTDTVIIHTFDDIFTSEMTVKQAQAKFHEVYDDKLIFYTKLEQDPIQITDSTLISQLDAIYEHLQLVKGTNNITVTPSDLAPYMQLSYMQDLPSKLDNLDSRLSLLE